MPKKLDLSPEEKKERRAAQLRQAQATFRAKQALAALSDRKDTETAREILERTAASISKMASTARDEHHATLFKMWAAEIERATRQLPGAPATEQSSPEATILIT
jgi:hypothetical protein